MTRNRAIISLDLQNALVHPEGKFAGAGFPAEVARRDVLNRAAGVLERGREAGLPVAHVRVAFRSDYADVHSRSSGSMACARMARCRSTAGAPSSTRRQGRSAQRHLHETISESLPDDWVDKLACPTRG